MLRRLIATLLLLPACATAGYYVTLVLVSSGAGYGNLVDPGQASQYVAAYRSDLPSGPWTNKFCPYSIYTNADMWLAAPTNTYPLPVGTASQANFAVATSTNDWIVSGAAWTTNFGGSMYFDGTDDELLTRTAPVLSNGMSVGAWIVPNSTSIQYQGIATFGGPAPLANGTRVENFFLNYGNFRFTVMDAQSDYIAIFVPGILSNTITHCVATWSGTLDTNGLALYTNGILVTQPQYDQSGTFNRPSATNNELRLGTLGLFEFGGRMMQYIRISRSATGTEVTNWFNSECAQYGKSPLTP